MKYLALIRALLLGTIDGLEAGTLSMGVTWPASNPNARALNNAYDYGANIGEWWWDLFHGYSIRRAPWHQRRRAP